MRLFLFMEWCHRHDQASEIVCVIISPLLVPGANLYKAKESVLRIEDCQGNKDVGAWCSIHSQCDLASTAPRLSRWKLHVSSEVVAEASLICLEGVAVELSSWSRIDYRSCLGWWQGLHFLLRTIGLDWHC
jgi:hypothetical protein